MLAVRSGAGHPLSTMRELLHERSRLFAAIASGHGLRRSAQSSVLITVACTLAFGTAVGAHAGGWQMAISAAKMPILLLGPLFLCAPLLALTAPVLGIRLSPYSAIALALLSISATAVSLASLSPIVLLFAVSLPNDSPAEYRLFVLGVSLSVVLAGVTSLRVLWTALAEASLRGRQRVVVFILWFGIYQFVGAQVAWVFRPFVGAPGLPVQVLRPDALNGNFYESVTRVTGSLLRGSGRDRH